MRRGLDDRQDLSQLERLISSSQWNRLEAFTEKKLHCPEDIGRDDDELAREADFDDGLRELAVERGTGDNDFAFTGLVIALALRDLPREDDVLVTAASLNADDTGVSLH